MVEAIQKKDSTKAEALFQSADNLEKHNWVPNTTRCSMPFTMKTTAASAVIPYRRRHCFSSSSARAPLPAAVVCRGRPV
jgi:hypothetical protein